MVSLRTLGAVAANLFGELIGPSRCAACDGACGGGDGFKARLFCPPCAASVERVDPAVTGHPPSLAAFEYGGAIATAATRLKYEGRADLGPRLGQSMLVAASSIRGAVDLIVPVPLHPRRLAERGYNHAALLAAPIARAFDVKLDARGLVRLRDTPRQASLDRDARLRNVAAAFTPRVPFRNARVLLVDDVRTTGATLAACRAALHEAGARDVIALVLARRA